MNTSPGLSRDEEALLSLHKRTDTLARVLVVEDDDDMRAWVEEVLREEGYEVRGAPDSLSALVALLQETPDVVVTDWKMPDMDGLQLLAALRRCNPQVQVVFVTAYADEPFLKRVMHEGAFSCLSKPFPRRHLLAHVQGAVICSRLAGQRSHPA
ncbi:MAG TPA: response regulator [Candidatus Cryosericum sp.]|nr:response regulator [Candidatus Cryosericum sp.]